MLSLLLQHLPRYEQTTLQAPIASGQNIPTATTAQLQRTETFSFASLRCFVTVIKKVTGLQNCVPFIGKHYLGVEITNMDTELSFRRRKSCIYIHTSLYNLRIVKGLSGERILTERSPFLSLLIIQPIHGGSENTHFITD